MKKALFAFLLLFITPAFAADPIPAAFGTAKGDNKVVFKAEVVETAIRDMVAQENKAQTIAEYEKQMDKTTGEISIPGLYRVCTAAGFDVRQTHGFNDCRRFVSFMLSKTLKGGDIDKCFGEWNGVKTDGKCVGRDGHPIVYGKACADKNLGTCVRDFNDLSTQVPTGKEFILQWGRMQKPALNITCSNYPYRTATPPGLNIRPQDFLQCTAGGKAYEFEFDSLNKDPGKASAASENKAICETLFGGKIKKYDGRDFEVYCDIADCKPMISFASSIGRASGGVLGGCNLKADVDKVTTMFLNTAFGIDNKIFFKSKIQSRADLVQKQLEDYLRTHPNTSGKQIRCDSNIKKVMGIIDHDYVMTCWVDGQPIDFLFDDLTEADNMEVKAGVAGMNCVITGGTYRGKTCRGLDKAECKKLDVFLKANGSPKGATYDDEARACFLGDAVAKHTRDMWINAGVGAVVIVGGTIVTIASGGTAAPVLVAGAKMLIVDAVFNVALEIDDRMEDTKAARRFKSFMDDAMKCTNEACAIKVLTNHHARLSEVRDDLNKSDESDIQTALNKLFGLMTSEYVVCGMDASGNEVIMPAAACDATARSRLHLTDYIGNVSGQILIVGAIAYNPGIVTRNFVKLKNIGRVHRMEQAAKLADFHDITKMSALDRKFYEAYKTYAPKNQTFDDFRRMLTNSETELDKAVRNWRPQSERAARIAESNDAEKALFNKMDELNIDALPAGPKDTERLMQQHPEMRRLHDNAENARLASVDNYSTFDPEISKMTQENNAYLSVMADDLLNKKLAELNISKLPEDPKELGRLLNQHPDLKKYYDDSMLMANRTGSQNWINRFNAQNEYDVNVAFINRASNDLNSAVDDYRTLARKYYGDQFDGHIANVFYNNRDPEALAAINKMNKEHPDLAKAYNSADGFRNNMVGLYGSTNTNDALIITKQKELITRESRIAEEVLHNVAAERTREFMFAIDNDPQLNRMAKDFKGLSNDKKTEFGQQLIDRASASNLGAEGYTFRVISRSEIPPGTSKTVGGWQDSVNKEIVFVADNNSNDLASFMNVVAHEDAHKLDAVNANFGALGAQQGNFSSNVYQNTSTVPYDVYRQNWTEQSSFFVGDRVGDAVQNSVYTPLLDKVHAEVGKDLKTIGSNVTPIGATLITGEVVVGATVASEPVRNALEDINAAAGRVVAPSNQSNTGEQNESNR